MYTSKPIKHHNKCLAILEMIQKVNNRIEEQRNRLYHYDNTKNPYAPIRLMNTRESIVDRMESNKAIAARLERYYERTFVQLLPAMFQD